MNMRLSLCNEVIAKMPYAEQCVYAARLGYDGLEVAPYTLAEEPHRMSPALIADTRRAGADAGIAVTGLHWLLVKPSGLSISTIDDAVRAKTLDVMYSLVDLCAELGGRYLVHGSPGQRRIDAGETRAVALARAQACWAAVAERAAKAGVIYCVEPLSSEQTPLVNTLAEAAEIVAAVGNPALKSMLDCSSAGQMEKESLAQLADRWLPKGLLAHVQVNDRNRQGPGQGEDRFAPLIAALIRNGYTGDIAVEPFDYVPDGPGSAARAVGYLKGILEALEVSSDGH